MSETVRTLLFIAVAAALAITASIVEPESATPAIFSDEGQSFYPSFRDPQAARTIEIVDYDDSTATARPFQVEQRKGRWIMPSHNDYPVEAGARLAKTAAALIDLKKDQVVSDNPADHARYGVIDPLDAKVATLAGRGKRVTLRGAGKELLADFVLGKALEGKPGYRHVRVPGQKRVYAVKTDADPSARFEDWVQAGVVRVAPSSIRRVSIQSYAINESAGGITGLQQLILTHENNQWKSPSGETLNQAAIKDMLAALANLRIVDARPKPKDLAQGLKSNQLELTLEMAMALRQRGFFLTSSGRIFSNEGEMIVETADGVVYTLRFGEVATSSTETKPAGNRYLFATAVFDEKRAAKYGGNATTGDREAKTLAARFADWFYVITPDDFKRLRLDRDQAIRPGAPESNRTLPQR